MEHITKQQTILIALLVAIITAISTSVATVSLLDNPSAGSGQTIYKVIEKSIETVANIPTVKDISTAVKPAPAATELSPSDIASVGVKSMLRIYEKSGSDKKFVALGAAVGSKGGVLASQLLSSHADSSSYLAITNDNREIPISWSKGDLTGGFTFFILNYDAGEKNKVQPISIKDSAGLKLGSNVVALGGKESGNVVSSGIVTEFSPLTGRAATSTDIISTDMNLSSSQSGLLLFDTQGNLVAFETSLDSVTPSHFLNAGIVKSAIAGSL
ncbi:MAG: trypsin-like peptidase domain-containing protein [Patescibacteria group bacterium]